MPSPSPSSASPFTTTTTKSALVPSTLEATVPVPVPVTVTMPVSKVPDRAVILVVDMFPLSRDRPVIFLLLDLDAGFF